jgi:hypothetical protein
MFRLAAKLRDRMLRAGFTDNGGAIHSAERILNMLGCCLNYPRVSHISKLRHYDKTVFSEKASAAHRRGKPVLIEHVSPVRDLTRRAIDKINNGASDAELERFVRKYYRLVLLTPKEATRLNRLNRTKMRQRRLEEAGITLAAQTN